MTMIATEARVTLAEPLAGFPDDTDFTLTPVGEQHLLYSLRSVSTPGLRFVLAPADVFFPQYRPDVAVVSAALGGSSVELLLVLTIGTGLADATANLRAPILLARDSGRAVQVVLDDESLPMHQPLLDRRSF